jgi:type II secretory pathway pseudopilin PulG
MMLITRRRDEGSDGFTLVELIIYCMLLGLVLTIVFGLFNSTLRTERTVRTVGNASNAAQLGVRSIEAGVRNSTAHALPTQTGNNQLLLARTAGEGTTITWNCTAWYFSYSASGKGSIRYRESPTAIATPTAAQLATWTLLLENVSPSAGTKIFGGSGTTLTIDYTVSAGQGSPPALIDTSVVRRVPTWDGGTCF